MNPLDAVAAAIRERLLAGQPAPLMGLGTLVRQHVAARVEERADGTRVMLPPGETIGLSPSTSDEASLALPFARFRALSPDAAEAAYEETMDQIEAHLSATGEVRLPGVGLLRRTSSGVVLGVEAELLAAVNRTYEGLTPIRTQPAEDPTPTPSAPEPPSEPPVDAAPPVARRGPPPIEVIPPSEEDPARASVVGSNGDGAASPVLPPTAPTEADEDAFADAVPTDDFADEEAAFLADLDALDTELGPEVDAPDAEDADAEPVPVPFGGADAPELTDLLPPTPEAPDDAPTAEPPATDEPLSEPWTDEPVDDLPPTETAPHIDPPEADAPADAPPLVSPDDEWERETWTAPALGAAPSFDADLSADADVMDAVIEDADYDIVPPPSDDPEPTAEADLPEPDDLDDSEHAAPPILTVPPAPTVVPPVMTAAQTMPAFASDVPTSARAPEATPADEPDARGRRWWPWVLLLLVIALAVAAIWFWPEIRSRTRLLTNPDQTITVDAGPVGPRLIEEDAQLREPDGSAVADGALVDDAGADNGGRDGSFGGAPSSLGADRAPTPPGRTPGAAPATRPATARSRPVDDDTPAPPTGLGESPAPGVALLPPRLSGLNGADVRALAARDEIIDPAADAWTFVVLSTSSREEAEALRDRYRRAGYRSSVLTARGGQFRVCVGQFPTRDDAIRLRTRLPPQAPADTWALYLETL